MDREPGTRPVTPTHSRPFFDRRVAWAVLIALTLAILGCTLLDG